jgi:hypothetical protein
MDSVNQLNADEIASKDVKGEHHQAFHEEKDGHAKYADAFLAEGAPDNNSPEASGFRKLTSRQELVVFSACCISLFRK